MADDPDDWTDGNYPTDAALERLKSWPISEGLSAWLEFAGSIWHWPDFGFSRSLKPAEHALLEPDADDRVWRFATGGWSGNEDIICAMKGNALFWSLAWKLTRSGGLHVFIVDAQTFDASRALVTPESGAP